MKTKINIKPGYKQTKLGLIPEDWGITTLNQCVEFLDGQRKPIKEKERSKRKGEFPYYGASGIIDYIDDYIFDDNLILLGEDGANILFRNSKLAFQVSGKIWVNNHAHVLKPKQNYHIGFLSEYLESISYVKYNSGTAQPKLNKKTCSEIPIPSPPLPEQEKIAAILSTWDIAIAKTQKLLEKLQTRKKGLMQQLLTGKKRLKGFSGEWEEVRLDDIAELTSSKRIYLSDYVEEGIPFYRGKEISELKNGKKINNVLYIKESIYFEMKEKYGVPQINDILITAVGTLGNVYRIPNDEPFYFKDGNLIWIKKITQNSLFLEQLLNSEYRKIYKSAIGSSQKALTIVSLRKLKFKIPNLEEQKAIAAVLKQADEEIKYYENYLEKLEAQKKGLMQVLLTGALRVKAPSPRGEYASQNARR